MSEKLLSMFFDEEFVPHAYLDSLYSATITANHADNNKQNSTSTYIPVKDIESLRNRSAVLLKHLDYYTKELSTDLEANIQKLYNANSIISYSYDHSNSSSGEDKLKPTTRLEYYVNSLSISMASLRDSIHSISEKIEQSDGNSKNSISTKLIKLNQSKESLNKVLNTLNVIKSIIDINSGDHSSSTSSKGHSAPTSNHRVSKSTGEDISVSLKSFTESLNILKDTILEQFSPSNNGNGVSRELLAKVKELIELAPVFDNLGGFGTAYSSFVKSIESCVVNSHQ